MEPWNLSDGTKVYLGGKVEGDSGVAEWVRKELGRAITEPVCSWYGAAPHYKRLDVGVPHLLDAFLRFTWEVSSAPDFDRPIEEPRLAPPEGAVY